MLADLQLRALNPTGKIVKIADQQGLYAAVLPSGQVSFRFDYRVNGRRETLAIGKYDTSLGARRPRDAESLDFGSAITLAEARLLLNRAHRAVERGESPSRAKVQRRSEAVAALSFGNWADLYSAGAKLAESTKAMRRSVFDRNLAAEFGRLKPEEITPKLLLARCQKIKDRGAAAPAVHARDIVLQVFRFMKARGIDIANPAEAIRPSAIATFKARDRALSPSEIHVFFDALDRTGTMPTLRLGIRFLLLTLCWRRPSFDHLARTLTSARRSGQTGDWSPVAAATLNYERDSVVAAHLREIDSQFLAA